MYVFNTAMKKIREMYFLQFPELDTHSWFLVGHGEA
jgi:hypothetical protein